MNSVSGPFPINPSRRRFVQGLVASAAVSGAMLKHNPVWAVTSPGQPAVLRGTEFALDIASTAVNFTGAARLDCFCSMLFISINDAPHGRVGKPTQLNNTAKTTRRVALVQDCLMPQSPSGYDMKFVVNLRLI